MEKEQTKKPISRGFVLGIALLVVVLAVLGYAFYATDYQAHKADKPTEEELAVQAEAERQRIEEQATLKRQEEARDKIKKQSLDNIDQQLIFTQDEQGNLIPLKQVVNTLWQDYLQRQSAEDKN